MALPGPPALAELCPPAPFARYIAPSAAAMSSGPVRASDGNVAWPIDAATGTGPRVVDSYARSPKAVRIRSAAAVAAAASVSGRITANSSPP